MNLEFVSSLNFWIKSIKSCYSRWSESNIRLIRNFGI